MNHVDALRTITQSLIAMDGKRPCPFCGVLRHWEMRVLPEHEADCRVMAARRWMEERRKEEQF